MIDVNVFIILNFPLDDSNFHIHKYGGVSLIAVLPIMFRLNENYCFDLKNFIDSRNAIFITIDTESIAITAVIT